MEWSQDGTKLLVSGPVAQERPSIWMISLIGATLKKLRDDARDASLSPDGSQIVFSDAVTREIWLMNADGGHARVWLTTKAGYLQFMPTTFRNGKRITPTWFRNGKRILYVKYGSAKGERTVELESRDLQGGDPVTLLANPLLTEFCWGQRGRLIYVVQEPAPNHYDSNLWEQALDEETGRPQGVPRRLTDWIGFAFGNPELTADGKRFVFLNGRAQSDVYVSELTDRGSTMQNPRRLTLDERCDWSGEWSLDSKTMFLYSDRNGNFDIFKQGPNDPNAVAVVTGPEEKQAPQISPDGKWLLYMQWPKAAGRAEPDSGKLMRMPFAGGAPEAVMDFKGYSAISIMRPVTTVGGFPGFRCPTHGESPCVLAEVREKNIVFTAFDPMQGRKAELIKVSSNAGFRSWDLSPDGSFVALPVFDNKAADVRILSLDGGTPRTLSAMPWTELHAVAWAADGKSLFLISNNSRGTSVLLMDSVGKTNLLLNQPGRDIHTLAPSPDGHSLAFGAVQSNFNAWTIASFPQR
jgi:Tol biopolymer transport system component